MAHNRFKVCFVGHQCGKTCLIIRQFFDRFEEGDDPTLENNYKKILKVDDEECHLDILDTAGNDSYSHLYEKWFSWAEGFVIVYSITSTYSFDLVTQYRDKIYKIKNTREVPLVLVGTQADRDDAREITTKEGMSIAYRFRCPFVEASSKTGINVNKIFEEIVREIKLNRKRLEQEALMKGVVGGSESSDGGKKKKSKESGLKVVDTSTGASKSGMLLMKSTKRFKSNKKAWFVLHQGTLYYYKTEEEFRAMTPRMGIHLLTCTVKPVFAAVAKGTFQFELVTLTESFFFTAESQQEMTAWMTEIANGVALCLNSNTAEKSKLKDSAKASSSAAADSGGGSGARGRRAGNEAAWEELRKVPENCLCADCGAHDPDWISINLGLFMCIECSGVHRAMGVRISKVRSITLDDLDMEVIMTMKAIGNKTSNSIWEAALAQSTKKKPEPKADRPTKERFIRDKYQRKEFLEKFPGSDDPNALSQSLFQAAAEGRVAEMVKLFAYGAQVNWVHPDESEKKHTPLHRAVQNKQLLSVAVLLLNNADVSLVDADGLTPIKLCEKLFEAGDEFRDACVPMLRRWGKAEEEEQVVVKKPLKIKRLQMSMSSPKVAELDRKTSGPSETATSSASAVPSQASSPASATTSVSAPASPSLTESNESPLWTHKRKERVATSETPPPASTATTDEPSAAPPRAPPSRPPPPVPPIKRATSTGNMAAAGPLKFPKAPPPSVPQPAATAAASVAAAVATAAAANGSSPATSDKSSEESVSSPSLVKPSSFKRYATVGEKGGKQLLGSQRVAREAP